MQPDVRHQAAGRGVGQRESAAHALDGLVHDGQAQPGTGRFGARVTPVDSKTWMI